jgi:hypothetical protein
MSSTSRIMSIEANYAGLQGPRNCDPLLWSPPERVARSIPLWKEPITSVYTLTSTPQQVVRFNQHRALLVFQFTIPFGSQQPGSAQICKSRKDCLQLQGIGMFCVVYPMGGGVSKTETLSYHQHGPLPCYEWWAKSTNSGDGQLSVLEAEFHG